jgi:hypothetical protein
MKVASGNQRGSLGGNVTELTRLIDDNEPEWRRRAEILLGIEPGTENPDLGAPINEIRRQYEAGVLSTEREEEFIRLFGEGFLRPPSANRASAAREQTMHEEEHDLEQYDPHEDYEYEERQSPPIYPASMSIEELAEELPVKHLVALALVGTTAEDEDAALALASG